MSPSDPVGIGRAAPPRVTPGPWRVSGEAYYGAVDIWTNTGKRYENVQATRDDRLLIESAVNACFALNPTDPLAAAKHLEALVKTAEAVDSSGGWLGEPSRMLREALSLVTGKKP